MLLLVPDEPNPNVHVERMFEAILYEHPSFDHPVFHNSAPALEFVMALLQKVPTDRLTVDQSLEHPFITMSRMGPDTQALLEGNVSIVSTSSLCCLLCFDTAVGQVPIPFRKAKQSQEAYPESSIPDAYSSRDCSAKETL